MTVEAPVVRRIKRRPPHPADLVRADQTHQHFRQARATTDAATKARMLDDVVLLNVPVADRLAMRYTNRGIPTQDLVQVARLGLVQAVRRFDTTAGFDFLSFAVPTILGELKRHFRDRGWTVRPSRSVQELRPRILTATSTLTQSLERPPTRTEIARELGIDETSVVEAQLADGCFTAVSLDRPLVNVLHAVPARVDSMGHDDPALEWVDVMMTLGPVFRRLSDRDRLVLRLRFVDDMTQQKIGSIVGLTQMQVSKILTRILRSAHDELAG